MTNEQIVLVVAKNLNAAGLTHSQLHNAIFGPGGVATSFFKTKKAREAFSETKESKQTRKILLDLLEEEQAESSGKIALRLPVSVHTALKREAETEGVSVNQLILSKVAVSLKQHCA